MNRILLSAVALIMLSPAKSGAQIVWAQIQNSHIRASLGESGTLFSYNGSGRFMVEDVVSSHLTGGIKSIPIMYGPTVELTGANVPGSYLTVRIDGGTAAGGADMIFGDTTQTGTTWTGQWVLLPTVLNGHIIAKWSTVQTAIGVTPAVPPIEIAVDISLIGDMAKYQFTVTNGIPDTVPSTPGSQLHTVGLRFAQNFSPDNLASTSEGPVFPLNAGSISTETLLTAPSVPVSWRTFGASTGVVDLDRSAGGYLQPLIPDPAFITPDAISFAGAGMMYATDLWDFQLTNIPGFNFGSDGWDAAAGLYWYPRNIAPNQQMVFTTYFGLQHATFDGNNPWAAYVDGPLALSYNPSGSGSKLTPNPFTVSAGIFNNRDVTLTGVTATISLPQGLILAPGQSNSKTNSDLPSKSENLFSWTVIPDGTASGRLNYSVSFSSGPGIQGKVISRDIDIPALPNQSYLAGLQLVTFPYRLDNTAPTVAFGLNQSAFDLLQWDPVLAEYTAATAIIPGQGYWLNTHAAPGTKTAINLVGSHPVTVSATPFEIKLKKGWQQIGSPYLTAVNWQDVQVVYTVGTDPLGLTHLSIDQAAAAGFINPVLFRYDPTTQGYAWDQDLSTSLVPFRGFWVQALTDNVSILIPQPSGRGVVNKVSKYAANVKGDSWKVKVSANINGSADVYNFFGMSSGASNTAGIEDVQKPPAMQNSVGAGFMLGTTGGRSATYAQDLRAAGGKQVWNFVVNTPKPNTDVTVTWSDVVKVPKNYELIVVDDATGARSSMRQSSSIKVNSGANASRSITITAMPRSGANTLVLTGTPSSIGRSTQSASIAITSSMDAVFNVKVKDASGNLVRNLSTGRAISTNTQTNVVWDQKDNKGTAMPSGVYQIAVTATSTDGQTATKVFYHTVVR